MARQAAAMPTSFKRSDHGSYCFRRVVGTKRTTINTGTSDYSEAKKFLRSYLQGESATALAVHQKQHIHKVANCETTLPSTRKASFKTRFSILIFTSMSLVENLKTKSPTDPEGSAGLFFDHELISQ